MCMSLDFVLQSTTLQIIFIQIASSVLMLPLALLLVLTLQEKMRLLIEAYELSVEQKTEIECSLNVKNEFLNVMSVCVSCFMSRVSLIVIVFALACY